MNNKTEFTYGPGGGRMKIVETVSGSVTSTKQFPGGEERDGSGNVTKQFFDLGQRNGSTNLFYVEDHLGSIRTLTDNSGVTQASFSIDPQGRTTKLEGSADSDFGFCGMYSHARSGLSLTPNRAYDPVLERWLSRDPLEEREGPNLYAYVDNNPISLTDSLGLAKDPCCGMSRGQKRALVDKALNGSANDAVKEGNLRIRLYGVQGAGFVTGAGVGYDRLMMIGNIMDRLMKDALRKRMQKDACLKKLLKITDSGFGPDFYSPELKQW